MKALHRLIIPCVGALGLLASGCGDNDTCGEGFAQEGGVCVPAVDCGPGTVLDPNSGQCAPDGSIVCDQGTVFDPATGTCQIDPNACAAGTVFINNECIPEDEALEGQADFTEGPEPNDGASGIAGSFDAPAEGTSVSFFGCIEPTDDVDGDGNLDPDFDAWVINAPGPILLNLTADGIRGLSAGFVMFNGDPANSPALDPWQRFGVNLTGDTSARQVFLPAAGAYVIQMADSRSLFLDSAGAEDACYFTTVETVPLPAATALTVPNQTFAHKGDVGVFSYNADAESDILIGFSDSLSNQVSPGMVVMRQGALASVADGNGTPAIVGNLQVANDEVLIIFDPVFNFALVPQDVFFDSFDIPAFPLPTDGSTLNLTKRNGDLGGAGFAEADYLFFDVAEDGTVANFEITTDVPVFFTIMRDDVFNSPFVAPFADFLGPVDTISDEDVRFLSAGRYYLQVFDQNGVSGETLPVTGTVVEHLPTEITYDTALAAQTLNATGDGFHFVDIDQPIWSEFNVLNADFGGAGVAFVTYDLSQEGWLFGNYGPITAQGILEDGTTPIGQITRGDDRDLLVQIFPLGAPVAPDYDIFVGDRDFTDLAALTSAADITRDDDATVAGEARRYFVTGDTADQVNILLNDTAADASISILNRTEGAIATADANGAGGDETIDALVLADPEDFIAFSITTDVDSTVDLTLSASSPIPFDIAAGALTFADVCGDVAAEQIFFGDDEFLDGTRTLPFAFNYFGDDVADYRISSNGWVAFDPGFSADFSPDPMPSQNGPNGTIAPFWADLDLIDGCILEEANQVTIQWTGGLFFIANETVEFQLIIHDTGVIDFVYGDNHSVEGDETFGMSVGVEHVPGLFGHQIFFNEAGVEPGDSYVLTPDP